MQTGKNMDIKVAPYRGTRWSQYAGRSAALHFSCRRYLLHVEEDDIVVESDGLGSVRTAVGFALLGEIGMKGLALAGAADVVVEFVGIVADAMEQRQIPVLFVQRPVEIHEMMLIGVKDL